MSALTADAYAVALAAFMAMLLSHTTLKLAVQVSSARSGSAGCLLPLGAVAAGFGLWTATFVRILAFSGGEAPRLGTAWLLLSLAVAVSSQACALLFVACREPDSSNIAGAAFALAVGVGATRCAALDELSTDIVLHDGLAWASIWFPLTFLTFLAALSISFSHRDRSRKSIGMRCAATLAGAVAVFGNDVPALASSRWVVDSCCRVPSTPGALFAITSAALGCAVLTALSAMSSFGADS